MRHAPSNLTATTFGVLFVMLAVTYSQMTLARGGYAGNLTVSVVFATAGVPCVLLPLVRGGIAWRIVAAVLLLPLGFVGFESVRRLPRVFGG